MPKFTFHIGANFRCYGDVEVEAESIESALPLLTADYIGDNISIRETTTESGQGLAIVDAWDDDAGEHIDTYIGHELPSEYDPRPDSATIAALRSVLEFLEEEAGNRSSAGSEYSDYEREPRELADSLASIIREMEK